MKKNVSMSFCLLAILAVLSLKDIFNVFFAFFNTFRAFSIMRVISALINIIRTLAPFALILLLYLNTKQEAKKKAYVTLLICGIAQLCYCVIRIHSLGSTVLVGNILYTVQALTNYFTQIITGFVFLFAANSLKQEKQNKSVVILTTITVYLNLIPIGTSMLLGTMNLVAIVAPLLLLVGVSLLPKTLYDHDNCVFVNKKSLTVVVGIIVVLCIVIWIAGGQVFGSGSTNSGNGTVGSGTYRCNNCGGDGWDSANNSSCVWCGGDGRTSWNP